MTFEDMNSCAARNESIPNWMTSAERMTYMSLRLLYALLRAGEITREQGKELKKGLQQEHEQAIKLEQDYVTAGTLLKFLREIQEPAVKKVVEQVEQLDFTTMGASHDE